MAEKRMFTMQIVDSDAFLDMPLSTQALYFHLNMRADDDGFVNNPKKILRMIGASDDDLRILLLKRFVIGFEEKGVIVIKHWRVNNYLRKDRYHPTQYQDELHTLGIKDNGSYTEQERLLSTSGIPNGNQMATEISIDKDSIDKNNNMINFEHEFDQLWAIYPRKQGKKRAFEAYKRSRKKGIEYEVIKNGVNAYLSYIENEKVKPQYIKQGSTFFSQDAWNDEWDSRRGMPPEEDDSLDGIL